jgi:hypothetical protein
MLTFLTWIGLANAAGALLLAAATRDDISDRLLRRWTWILPADAPFRGGHGTVIWTWWAAIGTAGLAWLNLRAAALGGSLAREVAQVDVAVYLGFEALAIAGSLSRRYGPGLWIAHVLWLGQGCWGLWALASA